jgi:hypothetical protein
MSSLTMLRIGSVTRLDFARSQLAMSSPTTLGTICQAHVAMVQASAGLGLPPSFAQRVPVEIHSAWSSDSSTSEIASLNSGVRTRRHGLSAGASA